MDNVEQITIDFEFAVKNCLLTLKLSVHNNYCFFHLSQSSWRRIQSSGHTTTYTQNLNYRERAIMLLCLAFVPPEDVVKSFDTFSLHLSTELEEVFDYFKDHYIGGVGAGLRAQPRFEISMWNCHDRTRNNEPRANNTV